MNRVGAASAEAFRRRKIANSAETRVLWLSDMRPKMPLDQASISPKVGFWDQ